MTKKLINKLKIGALTLALAGGLNGCVMEHDYQIKIDEDKVIFTKRCYYPFSDGNSISVTKQDGRVIKYVDIFKDDLKLERVEISKNGQTIEYRDNKILEKAQKQFDVYLQKIEEDKIKKKETKLNQGLEDLN